jgi:glycerophosphoryl diester phosphodiesterase
MKSAASSIARCRGVTRVSRRFCVPHRYGLLSRTIFSSFNHYSLVLLKRLDAQAETAILFMEGLYEPWNYALSIGAEGLHCYFPVAQPELLQGAAEAKMPVRPFTVNDEGILKTLYAQRCAAVITDWPGKAFEIRNAVAGGK